MKISFNWLVFFLFILSQNVEAQPSNFYKEFSTSSVELSLFTLDTVHDGGYILIGSYENANGGNAIVIKTDSLGNELWRKRNEYFTSLDSTNEYLNVKEIENGFLLSGYIRVLDSTGLFNNQYLLTKIDTSGNTVWEKIFGDSSQERFQSLVVNADSTFFLSGLRNASIPNQLSLYKFDYAGNLIWNSLFTFPQNLIFNSIIKRYSDTLIFALTLRDSLTLLQHSGVLVLDTAGAFIDSIFLPSTLSSMPLDVSKVGNKFYLIEQRGYLGSNSQIIVLDSALNIFSTSDLAPLLIGSLDKYFNVFSCNFDSLTSLVSTSMVNQFGDTLWQSLLNEPYAFPNYIVNEDGCAVVCGRKDQDNTTTALGFLFRVCDTTLINEVFNNPVKVNNSIIVYSNGEQLSIILDDDIFKKPKKSLSVIDMNGKVVTTIDDLSEKTIYLKSYLLKPGVYSVVVRSSNEIIATKKFITK